MGPFEVMIHNLSQLGFFGFLLPWIFTFVVLFALLMKSKALGEDQKIIGIVSIAVAFFVVAFGGPAMARFFTNFFGIMSIVLAGVLGVILVIGLTGADVSKTLNTKSVLAVLAGVVIVVFVISLGAYGINIGSTIVSLIFILALLALAVMFITKN